MLVTIVQLQIYPDYQGRGCGRVVMEKVLDETRAAAAALKVLKENPAVRFYRRLGFEIVAEGAHGQHLRLLLEAL